jgi:outer membrane protein assembly factor BamB
MDAGGVRALHSDSNLAWRYAFGWTSRGEPFPAVAPDGSVYYGDGKDHVFVLNPDGTEKWVCQAKELPTTSRMSPPAVGEDGSMYLRFDEEYLGVDAGGTVKWRIPVATLPCSGAAIGADGTVYFTRSSGTPGTKHLWAVNPDGSVRWQFSADDLGIYSSPTIDAAGTIYIGVSGGMLVAVNPDGSEKWRYITPASVLEGPAIGADGTLYFGDTAGNIYALGPGTP